MFGQFSLSLPLFSAVEATARPALTRLATSLLAAAAWRQRHDDIAAPGAPGSGDQRESRAPGWRRLDIVAPGARRNCTGKV